MAVGRHSELPMLTLIQMRQRELGAAGAVQHVQPQARLGDRGAHGAGRGLQRAWHGRVRPAGGFG